MLNDDCVGAAFVFDVKVVKMVRVVRAELFRGCAGGQNDADGSLGGLPSFFIVGKGKVRALLGQILLGFGQFLVGLSQLLGIAADGRRLRNGLLGQGATNASQRFDGTGHHTGWRFEGAQFLDSVAQTVEGFLALVGQVATIRQLPEGRAEPLV